MKKAISVFMAVLMLFSVMQISAVTVFADEITQEEIGEAPVPEGWTLPGDGAVSGFKEFSYECDVCGNTHEGFIGILMTMLHMLVGMFKLGQKAVER